MDKVCCKAAYVTTCVDVIQQPSEKRIPDGPKTLPPSTPSAPRAMSSVDSRGGSKVDPTRGEWKGQREHAHAYPIAAGASDTASLRARIGDKDAARATPQAPTGPYRSEPKDDERDSRKRTVTGGSASEGLWLLFNFY